MALKLNYLHNLLYELSENLRIRKNELGKRLRISPQLVSYSTKKLFQRKLILSKKIIIDPAKFGLINVNVFFVYTSFEKEKQNEILKYIKNNDSITYIEEITGGADLLVEYTVPNLSFFNKEHTNFLSEFQKDIKVLSINPIIVKHLYKKRYLAKKAKEVSDKVISGDRDTVFLTNNAKKILNVLIDAPDLSVVEIAKKTKLNVRTVINTMKKLNKTKVVRGYSINLNYEKLEINAENILIDFSNLLPKEIDRLIRYCAQIPQIVNSIKLIGNYHLLMRIESFQSIKYVIDQLREEFKFSKYKIYDSVKIIKSTFIPKEVLEEKKAKVIA